ncbi:MAG: histidine--tRNA ligase [bacterium]
MRYKSIRGTKDILPGEIELWQFIEQTIRSVMADFNYREIRTPIFEETGLFARSIGELTDIVSKEMYSFLDRSQDSLTLRPEGTAAVLRAYLQNNLGEQLPLTKVYYIGPMFRQERPQAGRLRQFHQFGAEGLGSSSPMLDAEMMIIPLTVYRKLGLKNFSLKINSVGCEQCRPPYKEMLIAELQKIQHRLTPESQERILNNPLRVLDSKDEGDQEFTRTVPLMYDHLCQNCRTHFEELQTLFHQGSIPFTVDGRLVRGLDYYTKTAFEITSTDLGSQDALAGGGRYDLLMEELGGKPTPGVGFAAGMERLVMVLQKACLTTVGGTTPDLYIAAADDKTRQWAFVKTCELRPKGFSIEIDYLSRSLKAQMREANRQQVHYVVVVGETELQSGMAKLKNMSTGEEIPIALNSIDTVLSKR